MHKKNSSPHEQLDISGIADKIMEHPFANWVTRNATNILLGGAIFIVLIFTVYKFSSKDRVQSEADYYTAEHNLEILMADGDDKAAEPLRQGALRQLESILSSRPELNSKYDALLAQIFITDNQAAEAKPFADRTFKRTEKNGLNEFTEQGKISLLVAQGNYEEALKQALSQKNILLEKATDPAETSRLDALLAYNLLQIAALQQQVGNAQGELDAWATFKEFVLNNESDSKKVNLATSLMLQNLFSEGNSSIENYIEQRESTLNKLLSIPK